MKPWMKTAAAASLALAMLPGAALRAEEAEGVDKEQEMKIWMEHVNDSLEALEKKTKDQEKVQVEGFVNLRYDQRDYGAATLNSPQALKKAADPTTAAPVGPRGLYSRRAEFKLFGKLAPYAKYSVGYDFNENKVKDLGVEVNDLPFMPFDLAPEFTWTLKLGQFRQNFGIEPQTSSSKTDFSERAGFYGGINQVGIPKIVGERLMGVFLSHKKSFDFVGYELYYNLVNNASEDQAVGKNKIGAADAFPNQAKDEKPSQVARVVLDPKIAYSWMPLGIKIKGGASYIYDSQNQAYMAEEYGYGAAGNFGYTETLGFDAQFELLKKAVSAKAEFVARNTMGAKIMNSEDGSQKVPVYGLTKREEAWYATVGLMPAKFFMGEEAPQVELLARYENYLPNLGMANTVWHNREAAALGLKWTYWGNNHTAVNYYFYGVENDFNALAAHSWVSVQQQIAF